MFYVSRKYEKEYWKKEYKNLSTVQLYEKLGLDGVKLSPVSSNISLEEITYERDGTKVTWKVE